MFDTCGRLYAAVLGAMVTSFKVCWSQDYSISNYLSEASGIVLSMRGATCADSQDMSHRSCFAMFRTSFPESVGKG